MNESYGLHIMQVNVVSKHYGFHRAVFSRLSSPLLQVSFAVTQELQHTLY